MFTFNVKPDEGDEFEVEATSRDVVMWEKTGKGRSLSKVANDPNMTALYELAHLASRRTKQFDGSLDEFIASVDIDVQEPQGEDEGVNAGPTQRAR